MSSQAFKQRPKKEERGHRQEGIGNGDFQIGQ